MMKLATHADYYDPTRASPASGPVRMLAGLSSHEVPRVDMSALAEQSRGTHQEESRMGPDGVRGGPITASSELVEEIAVAPAAFAGEHPSTAHAVRHRVRHSHFLMGLLRPSS